MSNMLLHCGAEEIAYDALQSVPTPAATKTWTPLPHDELLDAVKGELVASGLEIACQTLAVSQSATGRYADRFFGLLEVGGGDAALGYAMMVGIRNSHDQRFPAGICVGSRVLVCDNLAFSAEIVIARKHTRHIRKDLPRLLDDAVGRLGDHRRRQAERIEAYQSAPLPDSQFHDLAIRSLDAQVVSASKIPRVLEAYREPSHDEFRPRTVWSAFNAFTEVLKGFDLQDLPRRTRALHGLCDMLCKLG
jgi:hypothetical protein